MRTIEVIVGLILAAVIFIALRLIGLVVKVALIAALIGYVIGHAGTRAVRGSP